MERELKIIEWVRKFGGATSAANLEHSCHIFSMPSIEGFISYRLEFKTAVVYGDPIACETTWEDLVRGFFAFCANNGFGLIFTIVSEKFYQWSKGRYRFSSIEFGKEFTLNPQMLSQVGHKASLVRRKTKHAKKEGVEVFEYLAKDEKVEIGMDELKKNWLMRRDGPQIHISHIRLFENSHGKRWFYALRNGAVVGMVILNRLESKKGWLLNHLMVTNDAPSGTSEALLSKAFEILKEEKCSFVTLGPSISDRISEIKGFNWLISWAAKVGYRLSIKYFKLEKKRKFWEKFEPNEHSLFILFDEQGMSIRKLLAIMRALNVSI